MTNEEVDVYRKTALGYLTEALLSNRTPNLKRVEIAEKILQNAYAYESLSGEVLSTDSDSSKLEVTCRTIEL